MNDKELETLATIMLKRHGKGAVGLARRRAQRCKARSEEAWARHWHDIAERIVKMTQAPAADD